MAWMRNLLILIELKDQRDERECGWSVPPVTTLDHRCSSLTIPMALVSSKWAACQKKQHAASKNLMEIILA